MKFSHAPVLTKEVIKLLSPVSGGVYVDCTAGGGGHSALILEASSPDGRLIAMDQDSEALEAAAEKLSQFSGRFRLFKSNFSEIDTVLSDAGVAEVDGILVDCGISSHQLDTACRGFSFQSDSPLDMRMDRDQPEDARELVNTIDETELANIIYRYGEERWSRRIAAAIVRRRVETPVETTLELASIVRGAIPSRFHEERIDPATRTFQAIRIAVNRELESLEMLLEKSLKLLRVGGRIAAISFHSLEDRIVKEFFNSHTGRCSCPKELPRCICGMKRELKVLTRKPVTASDEEIATNRRARSAKLRAAEKTAS